MLLEKAGIPYDIYERALEVKQLGSGMTLNATIAPMLRQVNLFDEFVSLSKRVPSIQIAREDRTFDFSITGGFDQAMERYGGETRLISRPVLYDLFLRQVPKERIHLNTKIVKVEQDKNDVRIHCEDGSIIIGDILVGADGAHSTIRKNIYAQLKEEGALPPQDDMPLPFNTVCLVGQTRQLTPEEIPFLAEKECQFVRIVGDNKPYAWNTFTTTQGTLCWSLVRFLEGESSKEDDSFRDSEWGSETAEEMCEQVGDFPVIAGGDKKLTVGDLINWTPKELISKVMLEEKVFQTWYSGRTVLMGDACHKFNPSGGAGAGNAIHDAIVLANHIHALSLRPAVDKVEKAFEAYKIERIEWVEKAFATSNMAQSLVGQGIKPTILRFVMRNMPEFMKQRAAEQMFTYRPQVAFLPLDDTPVLVKPAPQHSGAIKKVASLNMASS
ncbi:hypothetical protein BGZ95_010918 [Linnemannia exigua]|uniref:FAD-binding domain-containing protein n=1 Tax=Linnemannia exigua TaxID=604196 RepID=A0AAD4DCP5_9FUNG|nr:hypothetical protein BGZ95_010918 [Linnemannia exigua]